MIIPNPARIHLIILIIVFVESSHHITMTLLLCNFYFTLFFMDWLIVSKIPHLQLHSENFYHEEDKDKNHPGKDLFLYF